jgi:hypothetical protein
MNFDRSINAALALVALGLNRLIKPARRSCECAYQRRYESGHQQGRLLPRLAGKPGGNGNP